MDDYIVRATSSLCIITGLCNNDSVGLSHIVIMFPQVRSAVGVIQDLSRFHFQIGEQHRLSLKHLCEMHMMALFGEFWMHVIYPGWQVPSKPKFVSKHRVVW